MNNPEISRLGFFKVLSVALAGAIIPFRQESTFNSSPRQFGQYTMGETDIGVLQGVQLAAADVPERIAAMIEWQWKTQDLNIIGVQAVGNNRSLLMPILWSRDGDMIRSVSVWRMVDDRIFPIDASDKGQIVSIPLASMEIQDRGDVITILGPTKGMSIDPPFLTHTPTRGWAIEIPFRRRGETEITITDKELSRILNKAFLGR